MAELELVDSLTMFDTLEMAGVEMTIQGVHGKYGIHDGTDIIAQFVVPLSVISNVPVFTADTLSLKHSVGRRSAQRWELTSSLAPLNYTANDLMALMVTHGPFTAVNVVFPQNTGALHGRVIGAVPPLTSGNVDQDYMLVTGDNYIPRGTFIKVTGHSKIYMTTNDLNGAGTLNVFPNLRASFTAQPLFWTDDVICPMYFDTSVVIGMRYEDGLLMNNGEIKLLEAV